MIQITGNSIVMRNRGMVMRSKMPSAREASLRGLANLAGDGFERFSPRATNRYVRAWLMAVGQAGSTPRPLPVLIPSNNKYIKERITRQWVDQHKQVLSKEKWLTSWYPPGTKRGPFARRQFVILEKMKKREERLKEELEKLSGSETDSIILFGGRGKNGYATVRTKIYGGSGFTDPISGVMYLRNLEPHAFIVEKKMHTKRIVERYVKLAGNRVVSSRYATRLIDQGRRSLSMVRAY